VEKAKWMVGKYMSHLVSSGNGDAIFFELFFHDKKISGKVLVKWIEIFEMMFLSKNDSSHLRFP